MALQGSTGMLYHLPILSARDFGLVRTPGPGLANLLFPIARAIKGRELHGGIVVRPTMRQIKIGTYLRNEKDKRTYGDVFKHRSAREWRDRLRAMRAAASDERTFAMNADGDQAVRYEGLGGYFSELTGADQPVKRWLDTFANYQGLVEEPYDIAVHVRLTDFQPADPKSSSHSVRLPFAWYKDAVSHAASLLGSAQPRIMLFSDTDHDVVEAQLAPLRLLRDPAGNALTSMTNMSRARVLVASRSTFAMWGAWLGGTPTFWDRDFDVEPFFPMRSGLDHRI